MKEIQSPCKTGVCPLDPDVLASLKDIGALKRTWKVFSGIIVFALAAAYSWIVGLSNDVAALEKANIIHEPEFTNIKEKVALLEQRAEKQALDSANQREVLAGMKNQLFNLEVKVNRLDDKIDKILEKLK